MKMLFSVVALAIASPAVAQAAPATPHAGHAQQSATADTCTSEHAAMGHCTAKPAAAADPSTGHDEKGCCDKDAAGKMTCCEKAKAAGKKMECCEKMSAAAGGSAGHSGH